MLDKNLIRHFDFFFKFDHEIGFDILRKLSPKGVTLHEMLKPILWGK